jgi:hypothetical protein
LPILLTLGQRALRAAGAVATPAARGTRPARLQRNRILRRGGPVGRNLTGHRMHGGRVDGDLLWSDTDTCAAHQRVGVLALLGQNNGHDITHISGPCRTSGPVQVSLVLGRRIDVHDQFDSVDMHTPRGNVGGHQYARLPRAEGGEVSVAGGLRKIAVQIDCRDTGFGELPSELARLMFSGSSQLRV